MAYSVFLDKESPPRDNELDVLGAAERHWDELVRQVEEAWPGTVSEWVFSGKNHGWCMRLRYRQRVIVYLAPSEGEFRASFALSERAAKAARSAELSASVMQVIDEATRYPEGRAVRIVVQIPSDIEDVVSIAKIKMAN